MLKPISISLSPNTEKDDVWLAFKLLFQPWHWKRGVIQNSTYAEKVVTQLEREFAKYLGVKYAVSFNSGRAALMAILESLNLERGSEILLQAFTCNAVPNPIIWSSLKPVYVDIHAETFNIDSEDLRKKITSKSRAVITQHTFGLPAYMDKILEICNQNNLILIEDCAHSLGAMYSSINSPQIRKKVGTLGKVSFLSFSRDKVISSVYGGMVVTNDGILAEKIKKFQEKIHYPSYFWIFQQLLHPVLINFFILPIYKIFGKSVLILFQWLHILSKAVHWKEKRGLIPGYFPKRMPNALAILAINQLKKLENFNEHRKEIADFYYDELKNSKFELVAKHEGRENIFLRFAIKHPKAHEIIKKAWRQNILIGDWYDSVIAPADTRLDKMGYIKGSCPEAEKLAKETFNLPTHINISKDDAKKIIKFLQPWK